jgi:deoxyribodipyrimidine photo-lyase
MPPSAAGLTELPRSPRVRRINDQPVQLSGSFVLYWMIAARRATSNFALDRAVAWARFLRRPLVVLEAPRVDYPWASDRLHRFVLDGMADNASTLARSPALYYPYVERTRGGGRGLLQAVGREAAVVVTDEYPCFFLPHAVAAAGRTLKVLLESVDSNGILPIQLADRE